MFKYYFSVSLLSPRKLRTKRPQQILICFSFSLLGLYLVFLTGIEATEPAVGCTIVAVLIHFFTLASVAWMAVEATNMYLLFVKVLNANVSHFMLIACATAWGKDPNIIGFADLHYVWVLLATGAQRHLTLLAVVKDHQVFSLGVSQRLHKTTKL